MIKRILVGGALLCLVSLAGCDKPSEGDCKKAIANIRRLLGTDNLTEDAGQSAAWIRSCRGNAKRSSVKCAMEASTVDQLRRCGLLADADFADLEEPARPAPVDAAAAPPPSPDAGPAAPTDGDAGPAAPTDGDAGPAAPTGGGAAPSPAAGAPAAPATPAAPVAPTAPPTTP
ncbi:MAG: hypothetical protein KJZ91_09460 [Myxococcales bacterium]|nr:hypothetical protein [Myxococcales bacterium]